MTEDIKVTAYNVRGKLRAMKASIEADEENSTLHPEKVGSKGSNAPNPRWHFFLELFCVLSRQIFTGSSVPAVFQGSVAQMRIRKLQHSILQQDFVETMTDYNQQQMDHHNRHRDHIAPGQYNEVKFGESAVEGADNQNIEQENVKIGLKGQDKSR